MSFRRLVATDLRFVVDIITSMSMSMTTAVVNKTGSLEKSMKFKI